MQRRTGRSLLAAACPLDGFEAQRWHERVHVLTAHPGNAANPRSSAHPGGGKA
jgi:hypothetical protein